MKCWEMTVSPMWLHHDPRFTDFMAGWWWGLGRATPNVALWHTDCRKVKESEKQQVLDGPCVCLPRARSCPPSTLPHLEERCVLFSRRNPNEQAVLSALPPPPHLLPIPYTLCPVTFSTTFHSSSSLAWKCSSLTPFSGHRSLMKVLCHAKLTLHKLYVFLFVCLLLQRPSQDPRREKEKSLFLLQCPMMSEHARHWSKYLGDLGLLQPESSPHELSWAVLWKLP